MPDSQPKEEKPAPTTEAKPEEKEAKAPEENGECNDKDTAEKQTEENGEKKAAVEQPPAKEMRAVVLTAFGGLKSIKVMKKPEPSVAEGEVLIRVKACGLGFQDLMARRGAIEATPKTPFILGFECAGEVEEIGEGVEGFAVGDKVVALPEYRAWAELVSVPQRLVFKMPEGMSFIDAAAITTNFLVAHILLFELGGISPGKSVLIHSAGGGVGLALTQLCQMVPDLTIFGVASKSKHEVLKDGHGIHHLLERGTDYVSEVRKVSPEGVDLFLDCMGGEECNRGYALIKPLGKYIIYGSSNMVSGESKSFFGLARSWWQVDKISPLKLFDDNKGVTGFNLRRLLHLQAGTSTINATVEKVFKLWSEGKIKPVVDSTWALEDISEAMQKMQDRKNIGKVMLDPAMEPKPKPATPAKGAKGSKDKDDKKKGGDAAKDEAKENNAASSGKEEEQNEEVNGEAGDGDAKENAS
ncbi:synaptic vesicle membrane protein VAT-1 homolog-like [Ischnura elegans]|uniref:synaptic vesicle membrane protein VAT-1 homolog-like n=1 Tax=Ischnura elegans TaxID=197161 RepID=UPI001ED8ADFF|nr:synaptic vesicle membrane protein VAT-1 homolog-like [Ischnura elegans]